MTKMNMPEIKVVRFNESDVIVASGSFRLSNVGDSKTGNATLTFQGIPYSIYENRDTDSFITAFNKANPTAGISRDTMVNLYVPEGSGLNVELDDVVTYDGYDMMEYLNRTYYWRDGSFHYQ